MREISKSVSPYLSKEFHGRGVGLVGNAYFGIGRSWLGEIVMHKDSLALFCAPSVSLVTDAGVDAGIVGVTTLACRNNDDYQGAFISASLSLSAEAFLAPVSGSLTYSFGLDSKKFKEGLKQLRNRGFSYTRLLSEWTMLTARAPQYPMVFAALSPLVSYLGDESSDGKALEAKLAHRLLRRKTSLGMTIKKLSNDRKIAGLIESNELSAVKSFLGLLANSLTGCDAIAGAAALSVSASPIGVGVSHSYYTKLLEADLSTLKKATPFLMANPFLLGLMGADALVNAARSIKALPKRVMSCETNQAKDLLSFL